MVYSLTERKFILENYLKTKSYKNVRELFIENFNKNGPSDQYIWKLFSKFQVTGSVSNKKHIRKPHVLTEEKLEQIKQSFERSPKKSLRRRGQGNDVSKTSCGRAAKKLKFCPYRVSVIHELKPTDYNKRVKYCEWFLKFTENGSVLNYTFFTDEAWFSFVRLYKFSKYPGLGHEKSARVFRVTPSSIKNRGVVCDFA
jgi:hypothetical protein